MLTTTTVRPAATADLPAVAAIFAHYVETSVVTFEETPPPVADWALKLAGLRDRGLPFLVADAGDTIAGYAYAAQWRPKPAYRHTAENTVYLSPGHVGRGLGRTLMTALLDACAAAGVRQLVAVVVDEGDDAEAGRTSAGPRPDPGRDDPGRDRSAESSPTQNSPTPSAGSTARANPSLALHRSLGFTEAGRLAAVGYKHGRWLDTVLLQRTLGCSRANSPDLARRKRPPHPSQASRDVFLL
ncbi:GNAT family N-acetyltransferase [Jiangella endophytica]|uniref:GNAT family N-acetyltransferase n=1 Tax=Jiangella endophytica TaxID=1623398 RepID=UPI000E357DA2|nr:GNAT family N-acetyltransferase [Jiangella endophytica]